MRRIKWPFCHVTPPRRVEGRTLLLGTAGVADSPWDSKLADRKETLPAQAYYKAQQLRVLLRQQVLQALEQVDVLVQPTAGLVAQPVEPDPIIDSKTKTNRLSWLLTTTYSLANVPALSLPCGFQALQGGPALPIGLQIAGKPFAEVTVFKVAHAYEQQTPWHHQRPPL